MHIRKIVVAVIAITLPAASCGDDDAALNLSDYAKGMQAVEAHFLEQSLDHGPPTGEDYPIDDQLVYFTHAFEILETRVEGWKALEPPDDLADHHVRLVATMEKVQKIVLEYAQNAALDDSEFDMDELAIDAEVVVASAIWRAACRDFAEVAILLDAPVAFAGSCAVPTLTE